MSEKHSLQLSVERAQSELTEQKRLTDSLQLVSSLFSNHSWFSFTVYASIETDVLNFFMFDINCNYCDGDNYQHLQFSVNLYLCMCNLASWSTERALHGTGKSNPRHGKACGMQRSQASRLTR